MVQVDMFNVYKCYTVYFILFPMFPMFLVVTAWIRDDILSSVSFVGTAVHAAMGDLDFPYCGGIMGSYQIVSLALGAGIANLVVQWFRTTSICVLIGTTMGDATSVQMASKTEMTCVGAVNLQSVLRNFHDHRYQSPSHVGYCASCLTVVTNVMEAIFFQVEGVVALASNVSTPAQERHIRFLAAGVATAQAPIR